MIAMVNDSSKAERVQQEQTDGRLPPKISENLLSTENGLSVHPKKWGITHTLMEYDFLC